MIKNFIVSLQDLSKRPGSTEGKGLLLWPLWGNMVGRTPYRDVGV